MALTSSGPAPALPEPLPSPLSSPPRPPAGLLQAPRSLNAVVVAAEVAGPGGPSPPSFPFAVAQVPPGCGWVAAAVGLRSLMSVALTNQPTKNHTHPICDDSETRLHMFNLEQPATDGWYI